MYAYTPRVLNVFLMVKRLEVRRLFFKYEHEYLLTLRKDMFQRDLSMHHLSSLLEGQNQGTQKLTFPPDCLQKNMPRAPSRKRGPVNDHIVISKSKQFNPFKPNRILHSYQLDQSISILRVVW